MKRTLSLLLSLFLLACQPNHTASAQPTEKEIMEHPTAFYMGQPGEGLTKQGQKADGSVNHQPMGASFYKVDFENQPNKRGSIRFDNGSSTFQLDNVMDIRGMTDADFPKEGIQEFDISFTPDPSGEMMHQEALDKTYQLLQYLRSRGWKNFVSRGSARVTGKQTWRKDASGYLDFNYKPTLEEWMTGTVGYPSFRLFSNGVSMEIMIMRDSSRLDVNKIGGYFCSMTLTSELEQMRLESGAYEFRTDKAKFQNWRAYVPAFLAKIPEARKKAEALAVSEGFTIDTTYQDPPISDEYLTTPELKKLFGSH